MKKIERTTKGLQDAMFDELDALRSGKSTPQQARAKAALAATICNVTKIELDYARFVAQERASLQDAKLASVSMTSEDE